MGRFIPNLNTWMGFTTTAPGAVSAPAAPTVTAGATGGSLAAGTYSYKVTVIEDGGESLPSAAGTATTTGATSKVTVTLPVVSGAESFRIYGRTAGTELLLATVPGSTTSWVDTGTLIPAGALPTVGKAANLSAPTVADVNGAIDLTHFLTGVNASATGSSVPTPAFDQKFETSIDGTAQGTFTADMYRDDELDTAWETLPRGTKGFFILARYGGKPNTAGDKCEVWPVTVLSRAVSNMANNQTVAFTLTCSVPQTPAESAVVAS